MAAKESKLDRLRAIQKRQQAALPPPDPTGGNMEEADGGFLGKMMGIGKSAVTGLAKGATFNMADEMRAGIRAPFTDLTYDQELQSARGMEAKAQEAHPIVSGIGEVVGSIAPAMLGGGLATAGKLGATLARPAANLGGMVGRGAGAGAAAGGAAGFGGGEGDFIERAKKAANSAATGALTGALITGAIGGTVRYRGADKQARKLSREVNVERQAAFKEVDNAGITYDGNKAKFTAKVLEAQLKKSNLYSKSYNKKTTAAMTSIRKELNDPDGLTLGRLSRLRTHINGMANTGKKNDPLIKDVLLPGLDDLIESNAPGGELVAKAMTKHKEYMQTQTLEKILQKAENAGSVQGANVAERIKTGLAGLLTGREARFWQPEQLAKMQEIVDGKAPEATLAALGRLRPNSNGVIQLMILGGMSPFGAVGAGLVGAASAARNIGGKVAKGRMNTLMDEVAGATPYASQLPAAAPAAAAVGGQAMGDSMFAPQFLAPEETGMAPEGMSPMLSEVLKRMQQ